MKIYLKSVTAYKKTGDVNLEFSDVLPSGMQGWAETTPGYTRSQTPPHSALRMATNFRATGALTGHTFNPANLNPLLGFTNSAKIRVKVGLIFTGPRMVKEWEVIVPVDGETLPLEDLTIHCWTSEGVTINEVELDTVDEKTFVGRDSTGSTVSFVHDKRGRGLVTFDFFGGAAIYRLDDARAGGVLQHISGPDLYARVSTMGIIGEFDEGF